MDTLQNGQWGVNFGALVQDWLGDEGMGVLGEIFIVGWGG